MSDILLTLTSLVNPRVLWVILLIFFLIATLMSSILIYHWRKYGLKAKQIVVAEYFYLVISISLFIVASIFIVIYTFI